MQMDQIDAVIFDLGGVLLNLDYDRTTRAFQQLGLETFDEVYSQLSQSDLFDRFETGEVSSFHFINRLLDALPRGCNANQVVHAWNAMILDFPEERLEWLAEFARDRPVYLLSNTNRLHMDSVRDALERTVGHRQVEDYFEKVYLSFEMGMRKPHPATFLRVCDESGLEPGRTLFIDDSPQHVNGALMAGLKAVHLPKGAEVRELVT